MIDLTQLARDYGVWALFVLLLLTNEKAQQFTRGILGQLVPSWGERWKTRRAREQREWEQSERDRVDAVVIAKEMVQAYRQELADARLEIRQYHGHVVEIVGKYERSMASYVEVMRDQSELLRHLVDMVRELYTLHAGEGA